MDPAKKVISFNCDRNFGTESEVCSYDVRDFKKHPLKSGELPKGMEQIASRFTRKLQQEVIVGKWDYTHNNKLWVFKPDSSCGIEICSPVSRGWHGLKQCCEMTQELANDVNVMVDERCGFHLHLDVSDCDSKQIGSIIAHWIKAEAVILDSVPYNRKRNRYCQQLGLAPQFDTTTVLDGPTLIRRVGEFKYFTANTYHLNHQRRSTMELRIMEGEASLNAWTVKNWVRFGVHFVEIARKRPMPRRYSEGDQWSSLCWLDPMDVMQFLGFWDDLSPGMRQTRDWFVARLMHNAPVRYEALSGMLSPAARKVALGQIKEIGERIGIRDPREVLEPRDMDSALYAEETKI